MTIIKRYDILKENNFLQMATEYENERQKLLDARAKEKQHCHDLMQEAALRKLAEIRDRKLSILEDPSILFAKRDPRGFFWNYRKHFYENAWANLVRKYAVVYDKENLDKYPVATPLPRMQDLMDPYRPHWLTYEEIKELAAHCSKWRQK